MNEILLSANDINSLFDKLSDSASGIIDQLDNMSNSAEKFLDCSNDYLNLHEELVAEEV
jgi:hypothetical protein